MKPVLFNNIEFKEIMQQTKKLIREVEQLQDEESKELISELLKYFDLLHREPLSRILRTIEGSYPDLKDTLKQDYTIHTLLDLYDFENTDPPNVEK